MTHAAPAVLSDDSALPIGWSGTGSRVRAAHRRGMFASALVAITLTLASCGPDGGSSSEQKDTATGALGDFAWGAGSAYAANQPPMPEAVPMRDAAMTASGSQGASAAASLYRINDVQSYRDGAGEPVRFAADPNANTYDMLALATVLGGVLGSAPPDYGFTYGDEQPWAWETGDRYVRYVEPVDRGYRDYYYMPGSDSPFLVRDPWYSYGYRDGRLAAIYDDRGRVLDMRHAREQRAMARRYYARAEALREAAAHERHVGVAARAWARHRDTISRAHADWVRDRAGQPQWQRWQARHAPVIAARWGQERAVRRFAAQRFERWSRDGYRGDAPAFYHEAAHDRTLQRRMRVARRQTIRAEQVRAERAGRARQVRRDRHQIAQRRHQAQARAARTRQAHLAQRRHQAQARAARTRQAHLAQRRHQAQARAARKHRAHAHAAHRPTRRASHSKHAGHRP